MPVATGWARRDIIDTSTAPVLTGSTHASASAGMIKKSAITLGDTGLFSIHELIERYE